MNITHSGATGYITGVDDEFAAVLTADTDIVTTCLTGDFAAVDGQGRAVCVDAGVAGIPAGISAFTGRAVTIKLAHLRAGGLRVYGKGSAAFDFNTVSIYGKSYAVFYDKANVADNVDERLKIAARIHRFGKRLITFHHVPTSITFGTPSPLIGKGLICLTLCRSKLAGHFVIFEIGDGGRVDDFDGICRLLVVGCACRAVTGCRSDGRRTYTDGLHIAVFVDSCDARVARRPSDIAKLVVRGIARCDGGQVSKDIAAGVDVDRGLAERQPRHVDLAGDDGVSVPVVGLIILHQRHRARVVARLDDHIIAKGDVARNGGAGETVYRALAAVELGATSNCGTARRRPLHVQPTALDDQRAFAVYRSIIRVGHTHIAHIVAGGLTVDGQGTTCRYMYGVVLMQFRTVDKNDLYVAGNVEIIIDIHLHFAAGVVPTARKGIRIRVLGDLIGAGCPRRAVFVYVRNVARCCRCGRVG